MKFAHLHEKRMLTIVVVRGVPHSSDYRNRLTLVAAVKKTREIRSVENMGCKVLWIVILAWIFSSVGNVEAQAGSSSLPWTVSPGGSSDTSEYHTYVGHTLTAESCLEVQFTLASLQLPAELQPFVQRGDQRWAYEIRDSLGNVGVGTYTLRLHFNSFMLKDPILGNLDPNSVFDPTKGRISDLGMYVWDKARATSLTLKVLSVIDCASTVPGLTYCVVDQVNAGQTASGARYVDFVGASVNLSVDSFVMYMEGSVLIVKGSWDPTSPNRYLVDPSVVLPTDWMTFQGWYVIYSC